MIHEEMEDPEESKERRDHVNLGQVGDKIYKITSDNAKINISIKDIEDQLNNREKDQERVGITLNTSVNESVVYTEENDMSKFLTPFNA